MISHPKNQNGVTQNLIAKRKNRNAGRIFSNGVWVSDFPKQGCPQAEVMIVVLVIWHFYLIKIIEYG